MRLAVKTSTPTFKYLYLILLPLLSIGCTTQLTATKVTASEKEVVGHVYYLPRIEFSVSLERELKACSVKFQEEGEGVVEWMRISSVEFKRFESENEIKNAWDSLLADPILQRGDLLAYLDKKLEIDWKAKRPTLEDRNSLSKHIAQKVPNMSVPTLFLDVSMKAQAIPLIVPDEDHVYSIQYQGMQELLKGTNFTVETFPNGTLKSINVTLDDQTGSIIQSSLSGIAKIAASSAGFPLPMGAIESAELTPSIPKYSNWLKNIQNEHALCKPSTLLKLAQRDASASDVEAKAKIALSLSEAITQLEKELESAIKVKDQNQKNSEELSVNDPNRSALLAKIEENKATIKLKQESLDLQKKSQQTAIEFSAKATTQLDALRKKLTITSITTFQPDHTKNHLQLLGAEESLKAWLDSEKVEKYCSDRDSQCTHNWPGDTFSKLDADVAIYPSFSKLKGITQPSKNNIVYRQPVKSSLIVCKEESCLNAFDFVTAEPQNILLSSPVDIPQLGVLASLPLRNTTFQNNSLAASFSESGALTKLTYTTNAIASKAAETFSSSADTFMKFKEAKSKEGKIKLDNSAAEVNARTKLLESQLKQEEAQQNLDDFRNNKNMD